MKAIKHFRVSKHLIIIPSDRIRSATHFILYQCRGALKVDVMLIELGFYLVHMIVCNIHVMFDQVE